MIAFLLKYIHYSIFIKAYYWYYSRQKQLFIKTIVSRNKKYKELCYSNITEAKSSDTLFIIGSGYSLNNILSDQWKEINKHDTLGFNFSFINNDHIPTYYTCEAMAPISVNDEGRSHVADIFHKLYKEKSESYKEVIKIVSDLDGDRLEHFENYGRDLFDTNLFILKTVNGIAQDENQFKALIHFLKSKKIFDKKEVIDQVFKFRATLSMTISLGINLGYKNIVLCGIDLTDPRYFYSDRNIYPNLPDFRSSKDTEKHATILDNPLFISIEKVVQILDDEICKPRGIKLYIQNPNSALSKILPVYNIN